MARLDGKVALITGATGGIDIVFANAGMEGDFSPIDEMPKEVFTSLF